MKLPPLSASLLARQTPAVRALLAKAQRRDPPVRTEVTRDGETLVIVLRGVKMPSFFGYMLWSVGILIPLFVLVTLVWFV